jgi:hypothetical protein
MLSFEPIDSIQIGEEPGWFISGRERITADGFKPHYPLEVFLSRVRKIRTAALKDIRYQIPDHVAFFFRNIRGDPKIWDITFDKVFTVDFGNNSRSPSQQIWVNPENKPNFCFVSVTAFFEQIRKSQIALLIHFKFPLQDLLKRKPGRDCIAHWGNDRSKLAGFCQRFFHLPDCAHECYPALAINLP